MITNLGNLTRVTNQMASNGWLNRIVYPNISSISCDNYFYNMENSTLRTFGLFPPEATVRLLLVARLCFITWKKSWIMQQK